MTGPTHQILVIHGGTTFETHDEYRDWLMTRPIALDRLRPSLDWKDTMKARLGPDFDVLAPRMPNGTNAQYEEWKLWFSRILPLCDNNLTLIGHSLGGVFLVKYLAEELPVRRIMRTILIAAPFQDAPDESLASFRPPRSLDAVAERAGELHIFHSTDDPGVPYDDALLYTEAFPNASVHTLTDRAHCNQPDFPELIELLTS